MKSRLTFPARLLLARESDMEVCGEASSATQALAAIENLGPDAVLCDISLPGMNGYALLTELKLHERNVVTIEDPVEYQLARLNQIEVDLKRGLTFEQGLRSILRLDPDYILLGEVRDRESALIALEAASTGRVVLSTIHSRHSAGVVTALRSLGISNYEIAASLAVIVAQRLVRKLCVHCRKEAPPTDAKRRWLESLGEQMPQCDCVWHAVGCAQCGHSGYRERTGIFEVLPVDQRTYDLIVAGKDEHTLRQHLRDAGFRPLRAKLP